MIVTDVQINGVSFTDYRNMVVVRSMDQYNSSSNFTITYDSPFGRHSNDFSVGNEVEIFADDSDGTTKLLVGIIERVKFRGKDTRQTVTLKGRDFSLRLQDATVDPVVFTDSEISTIVTNIINNNVSDVTTNNVEVTETTLKRIVFNHTPVFEALKQLSKLAGYYFYVDNDKDLNFKKRDNIDSGIVLDNTNITKADLNETREGMFNSVFVYGDRALDGFNETFTADGTGSVFTLLNKPRNTTVNVNNNIQKGGVFELTVEPVSGADYLVSFNDRTITFISGTDLGYSSIPSNGSSVSIDYFRDIPIVKAGIDRDSITLFGKKEKIINDKSINDPNTAVDILKAELENANPFKGVEVTIQGWNNITPGNTARVRLSDFNIDEDVGILSVAYDFNKKTVNSEDIITIRLDKKVRDITDEITDIRARLNAIEESDRQETDLITRLETVQNEFSVIGSYWTISTRTLGSSFILGVPNSNPGGVGFGGTLGSVVGSGINFLGDSRTDLSILHSGGFYA